MKKYILLIFSYIKYLLILWVPILLIEETFLLEFVSEGGSFICSIIMFIVSLYIYITTYIKKIQDKAINRYKYNIINTIILGIINVALGYYFMHLIYIGVFHQCKGSGWDCFLFGLEYLIFGIEYALLPVIILIIWLIVRLIKYLNTKRDNNL